MAIKKNKKIGKIKIKLVRSLIGRNQKQRDTVKKLGLKRINSEVIKDAKPEILGMVKKIEFMLEVEEV